MTATIAMVGMDGVRRAALALREWPGPLNEAGQSQLETLLERCKRAGRTALQLRPAGYDGEVVHLITVMQNLGRLLLQYHFTGLNGYKPYVGAGVNYTRITRVNLLGGGADLEDDSWGGALQVGMDIPLDKNWSLNFDVKKVYIRSNVFVDGANQGTLKLDPLLVGVGLGYRF